VALCLFASPAAAEQTNGTGSAKSALLVKSDLGSGWSSRGSVATTNDGGSAYFPGGNPVLQPFASCIGVGAAPLSMSSPTARSSVFLSPDGLMVVRNYVTVYPSKTLAQLNYAMWSSPKGPACLTRVMRGPPGQHFAASLPYGTMGKVTVTEPNPSWVVPHAVGLSLVFPLTIDGSGFTAAVTDVVIVRGRTLSNISFTSSRGPFPASLAHHLVAVAYGRL
jgi:hypothetical protein